MRRQRAHAFSLLEVLVGLSILLAGLLAIAAFFPTMIAGQRDAELLTSAAALAQLKAEEIRRDNDSAGQLIAAIRDLDEPTEPLAFPSDPRLAYSFCGETLLYQDAPAGDPRAAADVARIIVRKAADFDPDQEVIYELRFD
ncbi:MAG TPA: type II secretion system protein [Candidatus Sumerlaeota bacterium]|nr:type II secretion system protein [Candidatus Sumerlaeota bacterium]HOR26966.1 type II secretion system protein [Candidatus Sumerlaeota bacterium]HPK02354.1 type II secretion system protein [Candidatus Sumerlaeota bacterium]